MTKDEVRQRMLQGLLPDSIWEGVTFYKRNSRYEAEVGGCVVSAASTMRDVELGYLIFKLGVYKDVKLTSSNCL